MTPRLGKRILAVTASATIGMVGALALASPASAHHTNISGTAACPDPVTGEWVVTWTITSWATSYHNADKYQITSLQAKPDGTEITGIPLDTWRDMDQAFVGEQVLSADDETAQIEVSAEWNNGNDNEKAGPKVHRPEPCEEEQQPSPVTVDDEATCDELLVTVDNTAGDKAVAVLITTSAEDEEKSDLDAGDSSTVSFPAEDGLTYEVTIDGEPVAQGGWTEPEDCDEPEPEGEGGGDEELPVTGAQSALIAGGALLLLTVGGAMYFMARRRRITFTA